LAKLRGRSLDRWLLETVILVVIEFVFLAVMANSFPITSNTGFYMIEGTLLLIVGYLLYLFVGLKFNQAISVVIACLLITLIAVTPFIVSAIITPKWSFRLTTDKPSYSLGENVTITATLENTGYFTQSFTSIYPEPIQTIVTEKGEPWDIRDFLTVWVSTSGKSNTTITVPTGHTVTATYIWDQKNTYTPDAWDSTYEAGRYLVEAYVTAFGSPQSFLQSSERFNESYPVLAYSSLYINVTHS
jgi:uncharacterized protein (DUF58 family)